MELVHVQVTKIEREKSVLINKHSSNDFRSKCLSFKRQPSSSAPVEPLQRGIKLENTNLWWNPTTHYVKLRTNRMNWTILRFSMTVDGERYPWCFIFKTQESSGRSSKVIKRFGDRLLLVRADPDFLDDPDSDPSNSSIFVGERARSLSNAFIFRSMGDDSGKSIGYNTTNQLEMTNVTQSWNMES